MSAIERERGRVFRVGVSKVEQIGATWPGVSKLASESQRSVGPGSKRCREKKLSNLIDSCVGVFVCVSGLKARLRPSSRLAGGQGRDLSACGARAFRRRRRRRLKVGPHEKRAARMSCKQWLANNRPLS